MLSFRDHEVSSRYGGLEQKFHAEYPSDACLDRETLGTAPC